MPHIASGRSLCAALPREAAMHEWVGLIRCAPSLVFLQARIVVDIVNVCLRLMPLGSSVHGRHGELATPNACMFWRACRSCFHCSSACMHHTSLAERFINHRM